METLDPNSFYMKDGNLRWSWAWKVLRYLVDQKHILHGKKNSQPSTHKIPTDKALTKMQFTIQNYKHMDLDDRITVHGIQKKYGRKIHHF
jgi:hypothetical protein